MNNINIPDHLLVTVMTMHSVDREEAENRIRLLLESGIMAEGVDDPQTQQMMNDFLARPSEESAAMVLFEKTLSQCMQSKEFVANYDRLSGNKFAKALRDAEEGVSTKKVLKQFELFSTFVRGTVFNAFVNSLPKGE